MLYYEIATLHVRLYEGSDRAFDVLENHTPEVSRQRHAARGDAVPGFAFTIS